MNLVTRQEVCDKALEYLNTPWQHQARLKHVAVDCAGLIIGVIKELEIYEGGDYTGYKRIPDGKTLFNNLKTWADEKPINEALPGDILLMAFRGEPQHVAFMLPNNEFIHSYSDPSLGKKVMITSMDATWKPRLRAVFKLRQLKEE